MPSVIMEVTVGSAGIVIILPRSSTIHYRIWYYVPMNEQERIRNKEYQKKWRQTNAAKIVEYRRSHGREHYQRYKERILAANKRWREKQRLNNPQYISM